MSLVYDTRPRTSWQRAIRRPASDAPENPLPASMGGRRWSRRDLRMLHERAGKVPADKIAAQLGRTTYAVKIKCWEQGLRSRLPAKRSVVEVNEKMAQEVFARCYPSMRAIMRQVSEETGVSIPEMLCRQRIRPIVRARQLLFWTMARDLKFSLAQMARKLGRDHTTLRCAIMAVDRLRGTSVMSLRTVENQGRVQ